MVRSAPCRAPASNPRLAAVLAAVLLALLVARETPAQEPAGLERLEERLRQLEELRQGGGTDLALSETARLLYGGFAGFSVLAADDDRGHSRKLRQTDVRLWSQFSVAGHELYGRLRFRYRDFDSNDSFDGRGDDLSAPIADRYWYRFDFREARRAATGETSATNLWAQAGRLRVQWASGIVLDKDLFALRAGVEAAFVEVLGLAARTPPSGIIDFDASRPAFDNDVDRDFLGLEVAYTGWDGHRPYVFILDQNDRNNRDTATFTINTISFPTRFGYDSTYVGAGSRGPISGEVHYHAEVIHEFGRGLSNSAEDPFQGVAQTRDRIEAWAGRLRAAYTPRWGRPNAVSLDAEILAASGDEDREHTTHTFGGNRVGSRDRAFNAFGFADTGLALAPALSNLVALRVGASTLPCPHRGVFERLRVGVNGYVLTKANQKAPISVAGVEDERFIGFESVVFVDWQLTSDVAIDARYGLFLAGDAIPSDRDDPRHFFYTGISYAF